MKHLVHARAGGSIGAHSMARLTVVMSLVCAMGWASGQTKPVVQDAEYESHIAEANNLSIDPVALARNKTKQGRWTMDQYIAFSAYHNAKLDAEAKEREARIAKKEAEAKERKALEAQLDVELMQKTKIILTAMKTLEAQGRFGPKAVADLNNMYNGGTEEVRALIRSELGKYLKP